jgi:glycosyl hydrolase family 28
MKKSTLKVGDPLNFGAVYDGMTDCSSAINQCIQEYNHVVFRGSETALVASPILVRTGTWLDLDPNFTIKLADNTNDVLLKNQWAESAYFSAKNGNPEFMFELYPNFAPADWMLGEPDRNIKITGGIFDGNGKNQARQDWRYGAMGYYGTALIFVNVDGFEMSNVKVKNPVTYNIELHITNNFRVNNINFDYDERRPNIDGLHLGGDCYNGVIDGITGKTFDDMVAVNGGDCWYPKSSKDDVILPQANKVWYPFAQGRIANIEIRSIMAENSFRAVRLLSNVKVAESPVDETEGMDNILIDGIYGSFSVNSVLISCHIGDIKPYGNITLRNIKNTLTPATRIANVYAEPSTFINNLIIDDYYHKTEYTQDPLVLRGSVKKMTLRNIFIEVADTVDLSNRAAIIIGDSTTHVDRLVLDNIMVSSNRLNQYPTAIRLCNVIKTDIAQSHFETVQEIEKLE